MGLVQPLHTHREVRKGIDEAIEKVCFPATLVGVVTSDGGERSFALVHAASGTAILVRGHGLAVLHFPEHVIDALVKSGQLKRVDQPGPREVIVI